MERSTAQRIGKLVQERVTVIYQFSEVTLCGWEVPALRLQLADGREVEWISNRTSYIERDGKTLAKSYEAGDMLVITANIYQGLNNHLTLRNVKVA
jgi:hypothetical protein